MFPSIVSDFRYFIYLLFLRKSVVFLKITDFRKALDFSNIYLYSYDDLFVK